MFGNILIQGGETDEDIVQIGAVAGSLTLVAETGDVSITGYTGFDMYSAEDLTCSAASTLYLEALTGQIHQTAVDIDITASTNGRLACSNPFCTIDIVGATMGSTLSVTATVIEMQATNMNLQTSVDMMGNSIKNVSNPVNSSDAATKEYVDNSMPAGFSQVITLSGYNKVFNLTTTDTDATFFLHLNASTIWLPNYPGFKARFIAGDTTGIINQTLIRPASGTFIGNYYGQGYFSYPSYPAPDTKLVYGCQPLYIGDFVDVQVLNSQYVFVTGQSTNYGIDYYSHCITL